MKQIVFFFLFAALFVACGDPAGDENPVISPKLNQLIQEEPIFSENKTFTGDGGSIVYQSRIGYDFDSALDSLLRRYESLLNTAVIDLSFIFVCTINPLVR